ncbi:MAG: class flavin-dependent oxidoreductase [Rhodospirillales bacterium]|nr:class flavin-dependent oxidoreductase [Rhodospirillales bacterium]
MAIVPPFTSGSISLRLYPHNDLPADQIVSVMRGQAALAAEVGFDGVMTSEHHGGFGGYLPNPVQMAGWLLDAMPQGWAAPCPLLLPLRPWALVAEELAWLDARYPGRVGLGVASGSLEADFEIMGTNKDNLVERFLVGLNAVTAALSGRHAGVLAGDVAIKRCIEHPIPVISAVMSGTAARRAAAAGAGMLFAGVSANWHCREMADTYRAAGGTGPIVLVRRVSVVGASGEGGGQGRHAKQVDLYRSYTSEASQSKWATNQLTEGTPDQIAKSLITDMKETGAESLNLRVHVPGVTPDEALGHIAGLEWVLKKLRA